MLFLLMCQKTATFISKILLFDTYVVDYLVKV